MRVLLVEDDPDVSDAIRNALRLETHRAEVLRDGSQAAAALEIDSFDAVILDLGLPRLSGLDILRHMRATGNAVPVLILTARDLTADRVAGLDAGADDYLTKPFDIHELSARLRAITRRPQGRATSLLQCGGLTLDPASRTVSLNGTAIHVSRTQYTILVQLMERVGQAVSREDLLSNLYGWETDAIDSNTIDVHISHLRGKIGKEYIHTLRGVGYICKYAMSLSDRPQPSRTTTLT